MSKTEYEQKLDANSKELTSSVNNPKPSVQETGLDKFFGENSWESCPFEIRIGKGVSEVEVIKTLSEYLRDKLKKSFASCSPEERAKHALPMIGVYTDQVDGQVVIHQESGLPELIEPLAAVLPSDWDPQLTWLDVSPERRKLICNVGQWMEYALEDVVYHYIPHHKLSRSEDSDFLQKGMDKLFGSPMTPSRYWTQLVPRQGKLRQEQTVEYCLTEDQFVTLEKVEGFLCQRLFRYLTKTGQDTPQKVVLIVFVRGNRVRKSKNYNAPHCLDKK